MYNPRFLVIMAGGASSRMKKSLVHQDLNENIRQIAQTHHKSLIPLGEGNPPLLYYHFRRAQQVGVNSIFIITPEEHDGFQTFLKNPKIQEEFKAITAHLIPQIIPNHRSKPLGTADAVLQAIEKEERLKTNAFVVINGDNLYSKEGLLELFSLPEKQQAMIGYNRNGLKFDSERIQKFAVLKTNNKKYLSFIIEKPDAEEVQRSKDTHGRIRVSMNIFKLYGPQIHPYLHACPVHPLRKEKELPTAIQKYTLKNPNSFLVLPRDEHVPDLTSITDLNQWQIELEKDF